MIIHGCNDKIVKAAHATERAVQMLDARKVTVLDPAERFFKPVAPVMLTNATKQVGSLSQAVTEKACSWALVFGAAHLTLGRAGGWRIKPRSGRCRRR